MRFKISNTTSSMAIDNSLSGYVTACALVFLSGCTAYFDTGPKADLSQKVVRRMQNDEGLPLPELSKTPPKTMETAITEAKTRQQPLKLEAPPVILEKTKTGSGDENKQLSIAEARSMALENNLDLKIALIEPSIAATYVSEEEAKFDDLIFANAKYANKSTPLLDGDVVSFKPVDKNSPLKNEIAKLNMLPQDTEQLDIEAGIIIPLRTGGKITLSSPLNNKETSRYVPSDQYLGALRFSMSQPLLRDAGIATNVAGIRIARYEQDITDLKTRLQSIRVLAAIDKAYWALYAAWGELDIRRQQYEIASQNLAMVRRRVTEGLTAAIETNRAEIGVAERMETLIVAKTKLKLSQRKLLQFLNDSRYDLDTATLLVPATPPTLLSFDFDRNELAKKALEGRLELLEMELKLAADSAKIDYLENQTLPMFMLDYSYGSQGRNDDFGNAYSDAFGGQYDDWSIGLKVEIPLTNELRKSRLNRAVQQRLQRLTTRDLKELTVRREIYDALDQVDQNWQRIIANRQNVVLAGSNYDAELKQFNEGIRTMTEVLETLTKLGDAQTKEVKAISDYQVALIDLAYATGTLLGYSKVDMGQGLQ
ncbi:TolC family protein [Methylicorpusculum sp.]|uniref:TolC family protein n=2 Tax=Methylicorpusculum sp. TaxID=2713644 RepID=UPI002716D7F7|nr:TolC family protein [Methylicorpusculum sp.]MDO9240042.1 TolC family protein [Methylicorpusculum sp.]MDP2179122.1 TolC family protein [Methylicorpusculum sp.]MDP3527956.1 TolC family protein [Methylicorpusculum sp.]